MTSCCGKGGGCQSSQDSQKQQGLNTKELKERSNELTGNPDDERSWNKRAAARGMLRAVDWTDEDFEKPLISVATPFTNITPCNAHIRELGDIIFDQIEENDAKPYIFGTPVVTDGEAMGTGAMKYSLPSRDLIADCIEMMYESYMADAMITLGGCDKTIPGALMPLARTNAIGITLYGGTILPGRSENGEKLDIVSIFEAIGQRSAGKITDDEFKEVESNACPTPGSCGGMYTANTMATAIEAMGMSLPGSSSHPATTYNKRISEPKYQDCVDSVCALFNLMKQDIHAWDIMTKKAFENALTVMMSVTGSTNGVLHMLALAEEAEVDLDLKDIDRINDRTPILADLKPSGKYVMYDLYRAGGLQAVMKQLLKRDLLHGDCMTVTGQTVAENLADVPEVDLSSQDVIYPIDQPKEKKGKHIIILEGNIAPEGCIFKQSGKYLLNETFRGPAKVYDSEEEASEAILDGEVKSGDVVVIRYEGPKGGPGMREMLQPTAALAGRDLAEEVALITDGRFSGGSHGIIAAHITPEAIEDGIIAVVEDGDEITLDPANKLIELHVDKEELEDRFSQLEHPDLKSEQGVLSKYRSTVGKSSRGAIIE